MHCFFPLCEEWLWNGKVKSYGLGGGSVVRGFGCWKLDVVFKWKVDFGLDALVV